MKLVTFFLFLIPIFAFPQGKYEIVNGIIILNLSKNQSRNRQLVDSIMGDSISRSCKHLSLGGSIDKIPNAVLELNWISTLEISSKKPVKLSNELKYFQKLDHLLVFSPIKTIEDELRLPKILAIHFENSKLNQFPEAICHWATLKRIVIRDGNFRSLPENIGGLSNLEALDLTNNKLSFVPDRIGELANLKGLGLEGNHLRSLPKTICNLTSLCELYVHLNPKLKLSREFLESIEGMPSLSDFFHD